MQHDAVVIDVPGDKSWSIRALLLTLLADGPSAVRRVPPGRITTHTLGALRGLGATVDVEAGDGGLTVRVQPPVAVRAGVVVDCGGSATLARLLLGLLAGKGVEATVVGSTMLSRRPMGRVAAPLAHFFGRDVIATTEGRLPARVLAGPPPPAGVVVEPGDSAQVRASVMLAALAARQPVTLWSALPGRRHTEQLLRRLGSVVVDDDVGPHGRARRTQLRPAPVRAFDLTLPRDPSQAAFLQVLAVGGRRPLAVVDVIVDAERAGLLEVMRTAGIDVAMSHVVEQDGLRTATVVVGPGVPGPLTLPAGLVPDLVDEVPVLAALCARASGPCNLQGLAELRVKESDRLARIADLLRTFGIPVDVDSDGASLVVGPAAPRAPASPIVTDHDHRIGMTAHVLARLGRAPDDVLPFTLDDDGCVDESWPGFVDVVSAAHRALWTS
jgi:3-phosphoshikimate 1-carboxyvinyltransferase